MPKMFFNKKLKTLSSNINQKIKLLNTLKVDFVIQKNLIINFQN